MSRSYKNLCQSFLVWSALFATKGLIQLKSEVGSSWANSPKMGQMKMDKNVQELEKKNLYSPGSVSKDSPQSQWDVVRVGNQGIYLQFPF